MGQRSQIYIRANGKIEIARYFQWCYGERLLSRARSIIEWVKNHSAENDFSGYFSYNKQKLKRICDVNFDMHDLVESANILEWRQEALKDGVSFNIYAIDNNDGQLFIDIQKDKIKYCFVEFYTADKILDGSQYLCWNKNYNYRVRKWDKVTPYFTQETIDYCKDNIKYLEENAELMTYEDLQDFISTKDIAED